MKVNFSYAPGTSLEQMIGFEMAGQIWSKYLGDDVNVNIHVETTDQLPGSAIGGALPGLKVNQSYNSWRNHLANDQTSTDDETALAHLQNDDDGFTALIDGTESEENSKLRMTRANAKAVGMINTDQKALDGVILMSNLTHESVGWNYDYTGDTVPSNTLDFLSVAIHEIGHILGFVSGVDDPGVLKVGAGDDDDDDGLGGDDDEGSFLRDSANPLDMFRYTDQSKTDGVIDLSVGGNPFFSIDGGETELGEFATGENTWLGGDGDQASHWKQQDGALGMMEPVIKAGERREFSNLDLLAMDVIGWDRQTSDIDLPALQNQAKENLAQQLGVTVTELEANPTDSAQDLTQDRTKDVQTMVKQSKVYEWGWTGDFWWENGLWQNFSVQTMDPSSAQNESPLTSDSSISTSGPQVSQFPSDFHLIEGAQSSDLLKGTESDDLIRGRKGRDKLYGNLGDDVLIGNRGRDTLYGDDGDDLLKGGLGADKLIGGNGHDAIVGGQGRDLLTGGEGHDRFVYQSIHDKGDRITDFSLDEDVIDVSQLFEGSSHSDPEFLNQALRWKQMGTGTVVQVKLNPQSDSDPFKDLLTLQDIAAAELKSNHFIV